MQNCKILEFLEILSIGFATGKFSSFAREMRFARGSYYAWNGLYLSAINDNYPTWKHVLRKYYLKK
jgi:hypothetical protein